MVRVSVKDVDQAQMVKEVAKFLKKSGKVRVPEWADLVKLGKHKELAPSDPDWYYTRTAALARRLYIRSPAGIGAFEKVFGGKQRRGVAPNHFSRASRSAIRKALQTLEGIKWVEKHKDGGRVLTKAGRKDLDRIAGQLKASNKAAEKAAAEAELAQM